MNKWWLVITAVLTDCPHCRYHSLVAPSVECVAPSSNNSWPATSGLYEHEMLQLVWTLSPPDCVDVDPLRKSTWMRPIVGDRELYGVKLLPDGSQLFQTPATAQRMTLAVN